ADHESGAIGRLAVDHRGCDVATLRTHSRYEERHEPYDFANLGQLTRVRCPYHQETVASRVPLARRKLCDHLVQLAPSTHLQILQVSGARVGRPAQNDHTLVLTLEEGLERVTTQVWVDSHRVCAIALERFNRIPLRGVSDVTALGIEDYRDARI